MVGTLGVIGGSQIGDAVAKAGALVGAGLEVGEAGALGSEEGGGFAEFGVVGVDEGLFGLHLGGEGRLSGGDKRIDCCERGFSKIYPGWETRTDLKEMGLKGRGENSLCTSS